MDLEKVAPILEQIIKESLEEKRYRFGFAKYQGTSNKVASGTLARSVQVVTKQTNDGAVLQVLMEEYEAHVIHVAALKLLELKEKQFHENINLINDMRRVIVHRYSNR